MCTLRFAKDPWPPVNALWAVTKDSPGKAQEANWLPAPDGPMHLVMRLEWPQDKPPSILPAGEATWSPPRVTPVP